MKRKEISEKFDEIVEFSEMSKFLDMPVKYYSSGMRVRLAFAVAVHLEPEILLVDEVLAVGDVEFQKKSLKKMEEVAKGGITVIFVSHNMQAISTLVSQCIYLKNGKIVKKGKTQDIINLYLNDTNKEVKNNVYVGNGKSSKPIISKIVVKTSEQNNFHHNLKPLKVDIQYVLPYKIRKACLTLMFRDQRGIACLDVSFFDKDLKFSDKGVYTLSFIIPKLRLYMGKYYLSVFFSEPPGGEFYQTITDVCPFEIVMYGRNRGDWDWAPYTTTYIEDYTAIVKKDRNKYESPKVK